MLGFTVWALTTFGPPIGHYAPLLFWVRALQVVLLLFVAPFLLASARPVAWLCALSTPVRRVVDRVLSSRVMRVALSPLTTSAAMLATPWLLYLTPGTSPR